MALGVRSYGNSLLMQNIYIAANLPNTIPLVKAFAAKILTPTIKCVEEECGTSIARRVQIPEFNPVGLINLDDNSIISDDKVVELITSGTYFMRVRDTSSCVSVGGFCKNCGRGYFARQGTPDTPVVGKTYELKGSARSFQNYVAGTFYGSLMGWLPLASDPLPTKSRDWSTVTSHVEMDRICAMLTAIHVNKDELEYLYTIEDILERALAIIGTYGVYGNA